LLDYFSFGWVQPLRDSNILIKQLYQLVMLDKLKPADVANASVSSVVRPALLTRAQRLKRVLT